MAQTSALRTYALGDRVYVTAQQFWAILAGFVMWGQRSGEQALITRGKLVEMAGYADGRAARVMGNRLEIISQFCLDREIPDLSSIAISRPSGLPGAHVVYQADGMTTAAQRSALAYNWYGIAVPTTGMLRTVWEGQS